MQQRGHVHGMLGSRWFVRVLIHGWSLLALLGCSHPPQGAPPPAKMLNVGARAPDVTGTDATGKAVKLSEIAPRPAVVYFYPKDETPGCTKEACAFRDAFDRYQSAGVVIFGVSRDSEQSHTEFRKKHNLPFPLVADESGAVQQAYGVPSKFGSLASRVSFLVDKSGVIARVWPEVDPGVHADDVLAAAKALP